MLKKLHLQFTFFCTLITSLILVGMSLFCLGVIETQTKSGSFTSFQNNINSILTHLEEQSVLTHQWLLQMEAGYHVKLLIQDSGTPLFFDRLDHTQQLQEIWRQAVELAKTDYALDLASPSVASILSSHQEFPMTASSGDRYYVCAALIPKTNGYLTVVALYSLSGEQARLWQQRFLFLGADTLAVMLLAIFSFFFTKRMIRPIEDNRRKQVQFIASASHELRSPLTVILSSLSAMRIAPPSDAERFAASIQNEGQRMSHLIDDMLALANADNHSWTMHPKRIELDTLLLQTYEKYESVAAQKGISFDVELPEAELLTVLGDGERLAQVLAILIDNAFSYTPSHGRVQISLHQYGATAEIRVSDNGPGVPDEQKESIFERFYRIDQAHKDKEHFGLGLCIAKEIIRLHKGCLSVTDTPGGGATFCVRLQVIGDEVF